MFNETFCLLFCSVNSALELSDAEKKKLYTRKITASKSIWCMYDIDNT